MTTDERYHDLRDRVTKIETKLDALSRLIEAKMDADKKVAAGRIDKVESKADRALDSLRKMAWYVVLAVVAIILERVLKLGG